MKKEYFEEILSKAMKYSSYCEGQRYLVDNNTFFCNMVVGDEGKTYFTDWWYAEGKVIYILKNEKTKGWGEASGYRDKLNKRNAMICSRYSEEQYAAAGMGEECETGIYRRAKHQPQILPVLFKLIGCCPNYNTHYRCE